MARLNMFTLLALCCLLASVACQVQQGGPHESQGGPHQNQGRIRRQAPQGNGLPNWTTCDMATSPVISCADCNTRVICKPIGGLLRPCDDPTRPYCNNGICSSIKAAGC